MSQDKAVIIIGQGEVNHSAFDSLAASHQVIALDGAANGLYDKGLAPDIIIGDMDSLSAPVSDAGKAHHVRITEQDSNDFEKALYHMKPPLVFGFGLFGKRFDQAMANLHIMAKYQSQSHVIAVTPDEIITTHQGSVRLSVAPDEPVAVIALAPLRFVASSGLAYPLDGLQLGFGLMVSSSNRATDTQIELIPEDKDASIAYAVCRPLTMLQKMAID